MESIYSKKVLEHFKNPRNMGEMENPDGVGKVGNPRCLLPDEKILFNPSLDSIKHSSKHEFVYSHDFSLNRISQANSRKYHGDIIKINNCLGKICLTPDHLVYAIKIPKKLKYLRTKNKKNLVPAWYHSGDLKKRDISLYPISCEIKDIAFINLDIPKSKYDFKSKEIPEKIPLDSEILRLFGYFLAEGYIRDEPSKTFISLTFNIDEKEYIKDISEICKKLFSIEVKVKNIPEKKTAIVNIYSARLARFFKKLFGNGASNKKLPDFLMTLPFEKQKALILGLWRGDGYINLNRKGPRAGYATISYHLANQIKMLLLRQGIIPSLYLDKARISKWANHKDSYRIHIGQQESLIKLCNILGINYNPKSYSSIDSWIDNNYLFTPITNIEKEDYSGEVYNLEVEAKHSFISDAFSLHNCGDIMYVYIKVEEKNGKIYLKDVKFQTMGCIAAIATSSMVTELAKGKTLEEAKILTNKDVADSLGSLPPIKMHCSNLAADALHKAIEDYEKKNAKK